MSFSDTTQAFGGYGAGDFITAMGIDAQVPHPVPVDTQGGGTDWVEVEILAPHMVSTETVLRVVLLPVSNHESPDSPLVLL